MAFAKLCWICSSTHRTNTDHCSSKAWKRSRDCAIWDRVNVNLSDVRIIDIGTELPAKTGKDVPALRRMTVMHDNPPICGGHKIRCAVAHVFSMYRWLEVRKKIERNIGSVEDLLADMKKTKITVSVNTMFLFIFLLRSPLPTRHHRRSMLPYEKNKKISFWCIL